MTAPFDFRRDVEIPADLIARLCAGEKQEKVSVIDCCACRFVNGLTLGKTRNRRSVLFLAFQH